MIGAGIILVMEWGFVGYVLYHIGVQSLDSAEVTAPRLGRRCRADNH
jgi:hypothetical protein